MLANPRAARRIFEKILASWRDSPAVPAGLVALVLLVLWPEFRHVFGDLGAVAIPLAVGAVLLVTGPQPAIAAVKQGIQHGELPSAQALPVRHDDPKQTLSVDITEDLPVAVLHLSLSGQITRANAAARQLLGDVCLVDTKLDDHAEGLGRSMRERIAEAASGEASRRSEMARCLRDGQEMFIQVNLTQQTPGAGELIAVLSDKTELKTLEAQFVQSQKMQAVGQLAGGVAHDFNNLLTAISGHVDLLLLRHESGDPDYGDLIQIRQNALRAAGLVKQLLAFSRKQTLQPKVLNLTNTLSELAHLLNRLLGEKVSLEIEYGDALWPVRVDERQMEQVIMNLVVNARDAMSSGGLVRIHSTNEYLSTPLNRNRAIVPSGRYVVLKVTDTGQGIDPDHVDKIFEPFFTTKRIGEGTGLGLSTAYGIIKQTGGYIFVDSTAGHGTVFTIYLPAHEGVELQSDTTPSQAHIPADVNRGRILLVEDEAAVRAFAARALRLRGFDVDEADCGESALEMLEQQGADYNLFVSDVIMPGIDGPGWVRRVRARFPETKVIFMSGYAEDIFNDGRPDIEGSVFLSKPFSLKDLTGLASRVLSS